MAGEASDLKKFEKESNYVNGVTLSGICGDSGEEFEKLLEQSDAMYILSHPKLHYEQVRRALESGKHVLCEAPVALSVKECEELFALAAEKNCILMEAVKTAYSTAYYVCILLAKSGQYR